MTQADYEKALLVMVSWQLACSHDVNELLAIACVIRNWVVPRLGEAPVYRTYSEACAYFLLAYQPRQMPEGNEPSLIDPDEGLMAKVDAVYDNSQLDVTSSQQHPRGARYFARVVSLQLPEWFKATVLDQQGKHPLIGTWGSQQFYA